MNLKSIIPLTIVVLFFSCIAKKPVPVPEKIESPIIQNIVTTVAKLDGKKIFENNCANCHRLYTPDEYSKQEWTPILKRMQMKADLSNEDITAVQEYIFKDLK